MCSKEKGVIYYQCQDTLMNENRLKMWAKRTNPQITKGKPQCTKNSGNFKRWNGKRLFWIIVNAKFWD